MESFIQKGNMGERRKRRSLNYTWVWWLGDDRKTQTKGVHSEHLGTWVRGANLESSPYWWLLKIWEQRISPKERHKK